jgi:hypothetical protein
MIKTFALGFIVGIALLLVGGVAGFQSPKKTQDRLQIEKQRELALFKAEVVDATPIQLGKLTERQQKHSKLYSVYQERTNKKISEIIAHREGKVLGIELHVGLGAIPEEDTPENYFGKLASESDAIIRGRVTKKVSQITEDDTFIFTDYDLVVMEVFKSNTTSPLEVGKNIVVTRPGGKVVVDEIIMKDRDHSFLPLPTNNQDVLLFLKFIPETGAYQATRATGSFELDGEKLRPLTKVYFPPGVLKDSNSFLRTLQAVSNR